MNTMDRILTWLRENYGWTAKKREWAVLAFGFLLAIAILVAAGQ
jgi:hypothetical protein